MGVYFLCILSLKKCLLGTLIYLFNFYLGIFGKKKSLIFHLNNFNKNTLYLVNYLFLLVNSSTRDPLFCKKIV